MVNPEPERRISERQPTTYPVEIHIDHVKLIGPSANLSNEGVYFLAEGKLPVSISVNINGQMREVKGKLVRVGSVNQSTLGVAVQFESPIDLL